MKTCGTQCYSSGDQASCSAKCLKGKGVQSSCASCLGRKIQCTAKNCLNFCAADANSPTCSSCVSRSCGSCNSEKSLTQPEEESFVTALVALSQKDAQDAVLRSAGCRESQSLMKTCGTQCYSSGDQASCSAKCLKGKGVQSSCASCLGRKIQCTVKNCLNFCAADANSPTCSSCVSRSCGSCNSEKSLTQPEEESFVTALVALSQKDAQDAVLRSAGCRESQSLMKTCGTQCYSSGDQASCSAKCLKGKGVSVFLCKLLGPEDPVHRQELLELLCCRCQQPYVLLLRVPLLWLLQFRKVTDTAWGGIFCDCSSGVVTEGCTANSVSLTWMQEVLRTHGSPILVA